MSRHKSFKGLTSLGSRSCRIRPYNAAAFSRSCPVELAQQIDASLDCSSPKTPVVVLVERNGDAICRPMPDVTTAQMGKYVMAHVDKMAALMTDESSVYHTPGPMFAGAHYTTNHKRKQYAYRHPNGMNVSVTSVEVVHAGYS